MKRLNLLILFILILAFFSMSHAHLDAGEDKKIDGYLIDFGFSPENPVAGEKVVMALNFLNETTEEIIEPENVWVRISNPEEILFSGTFHPEAMHVAFTFTFPRGDIYEILTRFKLDGGRQVKTTFQLNVNGNQAVFSVNEIILMLIIIGLLLAVSYLRRHTKTINYPHTNIKHGSVCSRNNNGYDKSYHIKYNKHTNKNNRLVF